MYSELDKAHANIVLQDRSEASFAYYHSLLLKQTLYVVIINSPDTISISHAPEQSALYFKTITLEENSIEVAFAFESFERLQNGADQIFEPGSYSHIKLHATTLFQQLHGQFILELNYGGSFRETFSQECVAYLADVNVKALSKKGESARPQALVSNASLTLIQAVTMGNYGVVKKLAPITDLEIVMDDEFGNTALLAACNMNFLAITKELVKHGADLNARNNYLYTALHCAASAGAVNSCEFLLTQHSADINAVDSHQWSPIHCAVSQGHIPVVKLLLEYGNDVESPINDTWGNTLLIIAALSGRYAMVKFLLAQGANINAQQNYGWTALHQAVYEGNQKIVELLMEAGIDRTICNNDGLAALDMTLVQHTYQS